MNRINITVDDMTYGKAKEYMHKKGLDNFSALIRIALNDYIDAQNEMPALIEKWQRELSEVKKKIQ